MRREDILGKTGLESFPPEEMEGFLAADRKAVREQAVIEKEESMTGPAGTVKVCTKKLPILDSSNQPLSLLGLSLDVTELRARENDLLEASRLLEEKVAERTAEFEKQGALLRRTQRLDALGRLAGGVAHDFNNLLCVVLGNASELLEESLDAETVRDLIQEIDTAARRAGQLTSQLLAFGDNQVLDPKPVDVEELLDNRWQLLERLVPPSIKLRRVRAEALPRIDVDMGQLEQVKREPVAPAWGLRRCTESFAKAAGESTSRQRSGTVRRSPWFSPQAKARPRRFHRGPFRARSAGLERRAPIEFWWSTTIRRCLSS